jgi:type I restriction enzyme, S subunit
VIFSTALAEVLQPVSRPEPVEGDRSYRLLGAHWYAKGLYTKDTKRGDQIQAGTLYRVHQGDFVYNRLFAWMGSFALASAENDRCYASNEFRCFEIDTSRVEPKFLYYYFARKTAWNQALGLSSGSTPTSRNRLKDDQFLGIRIPVPSLQTQREAVQLVDAVLARLDEADGRGHDVATELEAFWRALLRSRRELLELEAGSVQPIGNLLTVTSGGTPSRDAAHYWDGDVPWVKSGELLDGDIYDSEEHITKAALAESSVKVFPVGTILVAMYGQGQTRGRTGRLMLPATTNQACCALLPRPELLAPKFVQFWLRSLYAELRLEARAGAQPNWNASTIKAIRIAVPPMPKQLDVVARFEDVETKWKQLGSLRDDGALLADALRRSVLESLFAEHASRPPNAIEHMQSQPGIPV